MAYDETYDSSIHLKLEAVKVMFTKPYELNLRGKNTHTEQELKAKKIKNAVSFMVTSTF